MVLDRRGSPPGFRRGSTGDSQLRGTKALVAREQGLMVARGRADGRLVVIVPETKDGVTTGLQLLHVVLPTRCPRRPPARCSRATAVATRRSGTRSPRPGRVGDDLLAQQSVADLLTVPILDLADRWRT